jgi:gliding motility-associated-like protein
MRKLLFILVLLFAGFASRTQHAHNLHCLEVLDEDVTLRWGLIGNPVDFHAYYVYARNPGGSFELIDSVLNYNQVQYDHLNPEVNAGIVDYYVVTKQLSATWISDTLSTIFLTVIPDAVNPNLITLQWNSLHDPPLPGFGNTYAVRAYSQTSGYTYQGTTQGLTYDFEISLCSDSIFFFVEVDHSYGCTSRSNTASWLFEDNDPPPIPTLDSVSIDPWTGEAILGWTESTAPDAGGYQIYVIDVINDTLEPVYGVQNTLYIDNSFDPCAEDRTYAIAAFDTCGNISPGTYWIPQRTIFHNDIVFDPCLLSNTISWTEYINMEPALEGYRVYWSIDGGGYSILSTVNAATTSFVHTGLQAGHTYSYFIRAFSLNNEITSTSCIRSFTTWQYLEPSENRMENASVENSEYVELYMNPDTMAFVPYVRLYRSDDGSAPWDLLDELEVLGQSQLYYEDLTADVNSRSYYYRTDLTDSCGNQVLESEYMRTIFLQGQSEGQINEIEWNAFEGWTNDVHAYEIFRAVNENGSFVKTGEVGGNNLTFSDDISSVSGEYTMLRYLVRALQDANANIYSWSNEIFFEYTPQLYLPNAFRPEGRNPVFKPVAVNADFSEYRMDVYNRWGELVFSSYEFGQGWDGRINGSEAPVGVYVCILNYKSTGTETTTLKTTFVLIR